MGEGEYDKRTRKVTFNSDLGGDMIRRLLTKNYKEVPLLFINFNYKKFKKSGKVGSCVLHIHPLLKNDEIVIQKMNELVDYIRDNYDMNELP